MDSTTPTLSGFQALRAGLLRVLRAPIVLAGLWLVGLAAAAPATWSTIVSLESSFGKSRIHQSMATGFDNDWYDEYTVSATGLEKTFDPTLTGAGAVYDNLERWLKGDLFPENAALLATLLLFAAVWLFLQGGVLDRYAAVDRRAGPGGFFRASGTYFFRLIRLTAISGVLYFLVYRLGGIMLERVESATAEATAESTVAVYSLPVWVLTALLLSVVHVCFGFAKAAMVIEERRSALVAAVRGFGFVAFHPAKAFSLYLGILVPGVVLIGVYALVAPGPGQSNPRTVLAAVLIAQLLLLFRLALRLTLLAGQIALFRSTLTISSVPLPPSAVGGPGTEPASPEARPGD